MYLATHTNPRGGDGRTARITMTVFYWLIPLFVLAVAVAVIPVLYGTLKHQDWEDREAPLTERQQMGTGVVFSRESSGIPEPRVHVALHDAHADAVALLRHVEHLTQQIDRESERAGTL